MDNAYQNSGLDNGYHSIREITGFLDEKKVIIPSYQRGYRWGETQVTYLLQDVFEYLHSDIEMESVPNYCIQPLVVSILDHVGEKKTEVHVIDGQQRLTTLSLLLRAVSELQEVQELSLKFPSVQLTYPSKTTQTGEHAGEEKGLEKRESEGNALDVAYRNQAKKIIKRWIDENLVQKAGDRENLKSLLERFRGILLDKTQFIWYVVHCDGQEKSEQKVFENFNRGKIGLTDAELIKAEFMNPEEYEVAYEQMKDRQILIATFWDTIEKRMEDEEFWDFFPHREKYDNDTRIDSLFELYLRMEQVTFKREEILGERELYEKLSSYCKKQKSSNQKTIFDVWQEILNLFAFIESLYENNELYNLFSLYKKFIRDGIRDGGRNYYAECVKSLKTMQDQDRDQREIILKKQIWECFMGQNTIDPDKEKRKKQIQDKLLTIEYHDPQMVAVMLMFAVAQINHVSEVSGISGHSVEQSKQKVSRFPFYFYWKKKDADQKEYWQQEHIFARKENYLDYDLYWKKKIEAGLETEEHYWELLEKVAEYCAVSPTENPQFMQYVNMLCGKKDGEIPYPLSKNYKPGVKAKPGDCECDQFDESKISEYIRNFNSPYDLQVRRYIRFYQEGRNRKKYLGYRRGVIEKGLAGFLGTLANPEDVLENLSAAWLENTTLNSGKWDKKKIVELFEDCLQGSLGPLELQDCQMLLQKWMEDYIKDFFKAKEDAVEVDDGTDGNDRNFTYTTLVADNSIANMTLLPQKVNGSIGNGPLFEKKHIIFEKFSNVYIPMTALQIYMGKYEGNGISGQWLFEQRIEYFDDICTTLASFFSVIQ